MLKTNEKWLLSIIKTTKKWTWLDEGEEYIVKNNRLCPTTKIGYQKLTRVVRQEFLRLCSCYV